MSRLSLSGDDAWMRSGQRCKCNSGSHAHAILLACLVLCSCALPDARPGGRAGLGLGYRSMRDNAYGGLAGQTLLRVDGDWTGDGWPVAITGSLGASTDSFKESRTRCFLFFCDVDSVTVSSQTVDFSSGVRLRRPFPDSDVQWFVGSGLSYVHSDLDRYLGNLTKTGDSDRAYGTWLELGLSWPTSVGEFAVSYRSFAGTDLQLFGADVASDFHEFGIYLSRTW